MNPPAFLYFEQSSISTKHFVDGRKRVYCIWRQRGLKVPQKPSKKRRLGCSENSCIRERVEYINHVWAMMSNGELFGNVKEDRALVER